MLGPGLLRSLVQLQEVGLQPGSKGQWGSLSWGSRPHRDGQQLPHCHPAQCSGFCRFGAGGLDVCLGLWSVMTCFSVATRDACHLCIFCRMKTMGLVSAGTWAGPYVPSLPSLGQCSAQQQVTPGERWLRLGRGDRAGPCLTAGLCRVASLCCSSALRLRPSIMALEDAAPSLLGQGFSA